MIRFHRPHFRFPGFVSHVQRHADVWIYETHLTYNTFDH